MLHCPATLNKYLQALPDAEPGLVAVVGDWGICREQLQ